MASYEHNAVAKVWPLSTVDAVKRIRARDRKLGAYISTRLDDALREAESASAKQASGAPSLPLQGVSFGLKDEWETVCLPTTAGSYRFRSRTPAQDSAVYTAFRAAGAILVGKTNLSDMGLGAETNNYLVGPARNPYDLKRTAGGSSGGAAVAVADGMQCFDWGTDIGGSIRLPAAFCGIPGLRLSSETWPLRDAFPMAPASLSWMCGQGPLATTITQLRWLLEVAAPVLRTGAARSFEASEAILYAPETLGAWPTFIADVEPILHAMFRARPLRRPDLLPSMTQVRNVYGSLWAAHVEDLLESDSSATPFESLSTVISSILLRGRFGDRRLHPVSSELLGLMALGYVGGMRDRSKAIAGAKAVRDKFHTQWDARRIVVAPVCVYPPPLIGRFNYNPRLLSCTIPGNIADSTAISIPFGHFPGGLPRAVQLMGPPGSEASLLDLADRFLDTQP